MKPGPCNAATKGGERVSREGIEPKKRGKEG